MTAVIDMDSIPYIVSHVCSKDSKLNYKEFINNIMNSIKYNTTSDNYVGFIGGINNFRCNVDPTYKQNRTNKVALKTELYEDCIRYMKTNFNSYIVNGVEADDATAITSYRLSNRGIENVIVSADKDLLQCEGLYYSIKNKTLTKIVDPGIIILSKKNNKSIVKTTGRYHLWLQMLTGDTGDNVFGCTGIGPVKAHSILTSYDIKEIPDVVLQYYIREHGDKGIERFLSNYRLLNIIKYSNTMPDVEIKPFVINTAQANEEDKGLFVPFQDLQSSILDLY